MEMELGASYTILGKLSFTDRIQISANNDNNIIWIRCTDEGVTYDAVVKSFGYVTTLIKAQFQDNDPETIPDWINDFLDCCENYVLSYNNVILPLILKHNF